MIGFGTFSALIGKSKDYNAVNYHKLIAKRSANVYM